MKSVYEKVIVIGYGKVALQVIQYLKEKRESYKYQLLFIEHEKQPFSVSKQVCIDNNVPFKGIYEKANLIEQLYKIEENCLIISASNNFIFPPKIINKKNITIINFHNALLPSYRGRNAPSWVIFNNEKETGITWHFVNENIDKGNIIIQCKCNIEDNEKAYQLAGKLMDLAFEGFKIIFPQLIVGCIEGIKQVSQFDNRIYLAKQIPGKGIFNIHKDNVEYIYRLLRSTDYGKNRVFPKIKATYEDRLVEIERYSIVENSKNKEPSYIYLDLDNKTKLRLKYSEVE